VSKPTALSPAEAYAAIQALLDEYEAVGRTAHSIEKMLERNVGMDDVLKVLRKGTVSADPEWDDKFENWKYRVTGQDCEGERLSLIIALQPSEARITLITTF
jgi:hypothetical protein